MILYEQNYDETMKRIFANEQIARCAFEWLLRYKLCPQNPAEKIDALIDAIKQHPDYKEMTKGETT